MPTDFEPVFRHLNIPQPYHVTPEVLERVWDAHRGGKSLGRSVAEQISIEVHEAAKVDPIEFPLTDETMSRRIKIVSIVMTYGTPAHAFLKTEEALAGKDEEPKPLDPFQKIIMARAEEVINTQLDLKESWIETSEVEFAQREITLHEDVKLLETCKNPLEFVDRYTAQVMEGFKQQVQDPLYEVALERGRARFHTLYTAVAVLEKLPKP